MKKFTKIAAITALVMLVTGGILTAGGILFGASPEAFLNGLEKGIKYDYVFNRWFGSGWIERLKDLTDLEDLGTDWDEYWDEKGEQWTQDWHMEGTGDFYISRSAESLNLDEESMNGFQEGIFGKPSADKTIGIDSSVGNMAIVFESK